MAEVIVPAREARTMEVKKGQVLEIVDLEGQQVGDFTAWLASDPNEYLSPSHTISSNGKLVPEVGDSILSNHRLPLLKVLRDDVGRHDLVVPCCDPERYGIDYGEPDHGSCLASLQAAIAGRGIAIGWDQILDDYLQRGWLVRPIEQVVATDRGYFVVANRKAAWSDATKDVLDWLNAESTM